MPISSLLFIVTGSTGSILQEGAPIGGEPYNLPPLTAIILLIVLITILVLALAYNIQDYRPPEVSHHGVDTPGESLPEH